MAGGVSADASGDDAPVGFTSTVVPSKRADVSAVIGVPGCGTVVPRVAIGVRGAGTEREIG
jgi:hypothetical protein